MNPAVAAREPGQKASGMSFLTKFVVLAPFALGAASCGSMLSKLIESPKVTHQSISVQGLDPNEVLLGFNLDVENPNSIDLPIEKLEAHLSIDGTDLAPQEWKNLPTLTAKKITSVHLPIHLAWSDLWRLGKNILTSQEIQYVVKGKATVKGFQIPLEEKGVLNLRSKIIKSK